MTDKIVVFSTCASQEEAEKLARLVVERELAACATIVPNVRSYYRWRGAVETAGEYLLVIKSARRQFAALSAALERAHSYDVPEVLAVPVVAGSAPYLAWLEASIGGEKAGNEDASQ
jgi:periplasmic divalent cation tolerance protein